MPTVGAGEGQQGDMLGQFRVRKAGRSIQGPLRANQHRDPKEPEEDHGPRRFVGVGDPVDGVARIRRGGGDPRSSGGESVVVEP